MLGFDVSGFVEKVQYKIDIELIIQILIRIRRAVSHKFKKDACYTYKFIRIFDVLTFLIICMQELKEEEFK